jgi:hypothetical protein
MNQALIIKTDVRMTTETMHNYQKLFAEQLKTGVVLIPAYFDAVLVNVPTDVEVVIEAGRDDSFLDKEFHVKGE